VGYAPPWTSARRRAPYRFSVAEEEISFVINHFPLIFRTS
jgi:hypothetical protein